MPQLRKDPVVDRWVITSPERVKRPTDFQYRDHASQRGPCPFCMGNEGMTPPEIVTFRSDESKVGTSRWSLRVVPNRFPALTTAGELDPRSEGVYELMNGVGAHEVIIETPDHEVNVGALSERRFEDILWVYRARIVDLKKDKRFRHVLIFKNQGREAGATLEHTHSQLIALPMVPRAVVEELFGAREYYQLKGRCVYCDIVRQEAEGRKRIVSESENFVAICPFAGRFPFETWILPKRHSSSFEHASREDYVGLSRCLRDTINRINRSLNDPPFNYFVHSNPIEETENAHYHWHIEIVPKLTQIAGFELGSGFYINPVAPEESASCLREAVIEGL